MPFTPQEEEDLKKRILALEEEKTALLKREEGFSKKSDLELITADLKEARRELTELKAVKPPKVKGPEKNDPDADDNWPFDMTRGGEGE